MRSESEFVSVGDPTSDIGKSERNERWSHDVSGMAEFLPGEELRPPFSGGIGRQVFSVDGVFFHLLAFSVYSIPYA